jgi:hypothetical protein
MRYGKADMSRRPAWRSWTFARIWHSDLHLATWGRTQLHTEATKQDHTIPVSPQVSGTRSGLSDSGAGGARTHDRRIMSPLL